MKLGLAIIATAALIGIALPASAEEVGIGVGPNGVTVGERRIDDTVRVSGPRVWRVWALNAADLVTALDRHGYVHGLPTALGVDIELESDVAAAGLIAGLVHDGVQVVSCAPLTSSLEETYLQLTGEEA